MMLVLCLFADLLKCSEKTMIYVLPGVERIVTCEPGGSHAQFYDLQGKKTGQFKLAGPLQNVCEARGMVFLTNYHPEGTSLLITDKHLATHRLIKQTSLFNAFELGDKVYAMDSAKLLKRENEFPFLLEEFDMSRMRYTGKGLFKRPYEVDDNTMFPGKTWVLQLDNIKYGLITTTTTLFPLRADYLQREQYDSLRVATPCHDKIQLGLPEWSSVQSKWVQPKVVACENAMDQLKDFSMKRYVIFAAWVHQGKIHLAYGNLANKVSRIAYLDEIHDAHAVGVVDGTVIAAKAQTVWFVNRTAQEATLNVQSLTLKQGR